MHGRRAFEPLYQSSPIHDVDYLAPSYDETMDESSAAHVADVDDVDDVETLVDIDHMAVTALMPDGLLEDELDELSNLDARLVPGIVTSAYELSDDEEREVPCFESRYMDFE